MTDLVSPSASTVEVTAYIDGGARGNPGTAGAGVYLELDGKPWRGLYRFLGTATNNVAEYSALLSALDYVHRQGYRRLQVYSDSELLVRQIEGEYRVKNVNLQALHREASATIRMLERFSIDHVPRGQNSKADALANRAMDLRQSGEEQYGA